MLELGCGTGRVTIPLSQHCDSVHGIDLSEAMIAICREKLQREAVPLTKVNVEVGDITTLDLGRKFDFIIAPFRVFQNLETDEQVNGFFDTVRRHLAPRGTCILNVFNPNKDRETLEQTWCSEEENLDWEVQTDSGRVACYDKKARMDKEKIILYPELVYRTYENDVLVDETILKIVMRCYYPRDFEALIESHGFSILNRWGGYAGEGYEEGTELVIQFMDRAPGSAVSQKE